MSIYVDMKKSMLSLAILSQPVTHLETYTSWTQQVKAVAHNYPKEKLRSICALQQHQQGLVSHLFLMSALFEHL